MRTILLKSRDGALLFSGEYLTVVHALEAAIKQKTDLTNIHLEYSNLAGGNFDGAHMPGAAMAGANLSGANLSEANLRGAVFHQAALYNTCLCYSDLRDCDFTACDFGATDLTRSDISGCVFSTLSCFDLDFHAMKSMRDCVFNNGDGRMCAMTQPPVVVKGIFHTPVIMMDWEVKIGARILPLDQGKIIFSLLGREGVKRAVG